MRGYGIEVNLIGVNAVSRVEVIIESGVEPCGGRVAQIVLLSRRIGHRGNKPKRAPDRRRSKHVGCSSYVGRDRRLRQLIIDSAAFVACGQSDKAVSHFAVYRTVAQFLRSGLTEYVCIVALPEPFRAEIHINDYGYRRAD